MGSEAAETVSTVNPNAQAESRWPNPVTHVP